MSVFVEDFVKTTICVNCKHFIKTSDIWYNQFCGNKDVGAKKAINPVTGEVGYLKKNDLGGQYYDKNRYPFARDINKGNCSIFEVK